MNMQANVGKLDAAIRYIVGIALLAYFLLGQAPWSWLGLLGVIPIATAAFHRCPMWKLFGIDTRERGPRGRATPSH